MNRQLLVITVVAAVALVSAPLAVATGMHPDDRAYARSAVETGSLHPDDRAVARGRVDVPQSNGVHPDDRAFVRSPSPNLQPTLVRATEGGFDWPAAALGATGGFGIALMLLAATVGIQRRKITTA